MNFQEVKEAILQMTPAERRAIREELDELALDENKFIRDEGSITPEEAHEMMKARPMSPKEVIAAGLTGTWSHLNISDGVEWVNERKRERDQRRKWSLD